jgi:predicted Zn-dependent peptidase
MMHPLPTGSALAPILAALLACGSILAHAGHKRINPPNPADPMAVQIYQLDNGLTVYLTENRDRPRFHAEIAVRAGSKHDPAGSTGLAHYLEHMLFKGTRSFGTLDFAKEQPHLDRIVELYEQHFAEADPEKRAAIYAEINRETQLAAQVEIPNELDRMYQSLGEEGLNAHTWHEETVYTIGLPANRLEQWALIETERFQKPVFRLFQTELETVYEEKNQTLDNKQWILNEAVSKLLFKRHPYGQQTTIGEVEHLKNPSLKNLYRYYETWYVPNNMAIAISGDLQPRRTIELIDRHFSSWKSRPLPEAKRWTEEPLAGPERVTVKYKGEEMVRLAFRLPGRGHPDAEALKLVDMILDNSTAGLINLNLNQKQRVRRAGAGPEVNNDYGSEQLWGIPKKDQSLEDVEKLLLEQIELVKRGAFDDWILPAIINDFKKNRKAALEANESRVAWMRGSFIAFEDWDHAVAEINRLEKVTKADVVRVANQYFGRGYVAGYRIDAQHEVPKIAKPPIDAIAIDSTRESAFVKQVLAMPVKPIEPVFVKPGRDYRKEELQPGVQLYTSQNPLNDLFGLTISVDLGSRHDNRLAMATQLLDKSGTKRFSAEQLKKEWYKLGSEFGVGIGDNETSINLSGLDENLDASLALLMEVLRQPTADTATLEELKKIILVQREDTKKDFRAVAGAVALFNRYSAKSPYLQALPNDAVQAMPMETLHGLTRGLLNYPLTVTYTGSLPVKRVQEMLRRHLGREVGLQPAPAYVFLTAAAPSASRVYLFHKEMAQSQVRFEFGDGVYDEANFPAVQFYNEYFSGGMSGIVFQELREARALAYSAGAVYGLGSRKGEENVMIGAIGTQTDKTIDAVEAFLGLLDNLPTSPERFQAARDAILTRYRTGKVGFREVLGTVRSWERLEVPIDPRRARFAKAQKVGLDRVLQFHREHLKGKPKLISIVGDKFKIDLDRLKKSGAITELELKDLFAF